MDNNLAKSLTDLIDETLAEIEALKKSDRFSAQEIELGHDADGSTDTHAVNKAEDEEEEEEGEEEGEEHEEGEEDEAKKAEKAYYKAEEECKKAEKAWKDAMAKRDMCKAEHDKHYAKAEDEDEEGEEELDKKEKKIKKMEKKLTKSLEERVAPLESQIAQVLEAVKQISEAPIPARGATYKTVQPLAKGANEIESLNKSQVLDELLTLKKSGKDVFIEDVLKVEIGGAAELQEIANKYGIK